MFKIGAFVTFGKGYFQVIRHEAPRMLEGEMHPAVYVLESRHDGQSECCDGYVWYRNTPVRRFASTVESKGRVMSASEMEAS